MNYYEFKMAVVQTLEASKNLLERLKELPHTVHMVKGDAIHVINLANVPKGPDEYIVQVYAKKFRPDAVINVMEAWMAKDYNVPLPHYGELPPGVRPPSEREDRIEVIYIVAKSKDHGWLIVQQSIDRDDNGNAVFKEPAVWPNPEEYQFSSRLLNELEL